MEESTFSELPQQICDRVPNTFYRYENKTRFWNGKKLQCEHKKAGHQCPTCNPEGWKQRLQKVIQKFNSYIRFNGTFC